MPVGDHRGVAPNVWLFPDGNYYYGFRGSNHHRDVIQEALLDGKKVPREVIESYPENRYYDGLFSPTLVFKTKKQGMGYRKSGETVVRVEKMVRGSDGEVTRKKVWVLSEG